MQHIWKQKRMLDEGETLRLESSYEKGHLGQEEVELYSVLNANGHVVGDVQYVEHTSIKSPFRNSFHIVLRKGARLFWTSVGEIENATE
jgi:hypothetical protein